MFLYGHVAEGIPRTTPFDAMTRSRYWMAGLVVAGAVMVVDSALSWVVARAGSARGRPLPVASWWRVWLLSAGPIAVGIVVITMTSGQPTLPWGLAVACALATVTGLAGALWVAERAARDLPDLLWLAADGLGLVPPLLLLHVVELPTRLPGMPWLIAITVSLSSILVAVAWILTMTGLRAWRRRPAPSLGSLLGVSLALCYLGLPLVHYLFSVPGFHYVTDSANLFASHLMLRPVTIGVVAYLAWRLTVVRRGFLATVRSS